MVRLLELAHAESRQFTQYVQQQYDLLYRYHVQAIINQLKLKMI